MNIKPSQDVIQPFSLPGWSFSSSHVVTVSSTTLSSHHSVLHSAVVLCHTHTSRSYRLKCLARMNNAQLTQQRPASPVRGQFVKAQRSVLVLEELPLTIWCQKHQINLDSLPPKLSNRSPCKATDKTRQRQQLTCPQEPFLGFFSSASAADFFLPRAAAAAAFVPSKRMFTGTHAVKAIKYGGKKDRGRDRR